MSPGLGRPWYARSLVFHRWLSEQLGTSPPDLAGEIDWLFKRVTERLARAAERIQAGRAAAATQQRAPYDGQGFPLPGEDPELEQLIEERVAAWSGQTPPREGVRHLAARIRAYLMHENKRRNLLGEGFEDVLASVVRRLPGTTGFRVLVRPRIQEIPDFREAPRGDKPPEVDLAIVDSSERRYLVTAKWSIRADREEQFLADFQHYFALDARHDFSFVLVTNEFDAARLNAACQLRFANADVFAAVVHVNPRGPLEVYGPASRRSAARLPEQIQRGRLISLEQWLTGLVAPQG